MAVSITITIRAIPTTRQSPVLNPTKWESQREQLQRYFLDCVSELLQLINAQSNAHAKMRTGAQTHNLLP